MDFFVVSFVVDMRDVAYMVSIFYVYHNVIVTYQTAAYYICILMI